MSDLTDFYLRGLPGPGGRAFDEVLAFTDDDMERVHDYIQWLFPLPEASKYQSQTPVLTAADQAELVHSSDGALRQIQALVRYWQFLQSTDTWLGARDHNHLRITRVIRSCVLLDQKELAQTFSSWCMLTHTDTTPETLRYWYGALSAKAPWERIKPVGVQEQDAILDVEQETTHWSARISEGLGITNPRSRTVLPLTSQMISDLSHQAEKAGTTMSEYLEEVLDEFLELE